MPVKSIGIKDSIALAKRYITTPELISPTLHPLGQFPIGAIVFIGTPPPPPMRKIFVPKNIGLGYVKIHGFHGNPLCTSQVGGVPKNQSYLTCYLS